MKQTLHLMKVQLEFKVITELFHHSHLDIHITSHTPYCNIIRQFLFFILGRTVPFIERNRYGTRIVSMDEESIMMILCGETNNIEINRKPLVMFCPKCCIPVMTIVNKKVNISAICTIVTLLCLHIALYAVTFGILCMTAKWYKDRDGVWKYVHFCPTCRYEIATYKPRVGCMGICGLTLLLSLILGILGLIIFLVIWLGYIR